MNSKCPAFVAFPFTAFTAIMQLKLSMVCSTLLHSSEFLIIRSKGCVRNSFTIEVCLRTQFGLFYVKIHTFFLSFLLRFKSINSYYLDRLSANSMDHFLQPTPIRLPFNYNLSITLYSHEKLYLLFQPFIVDPLRYPLNSIWIGQVWSIFKISKPKDSNTIFEN